MKVSRSALLPYSATQMYDIVTDIQSYPDFLNWCESVELLAEDEGEVIARLNISTAKLNLHFTTRNVNKPGESITLTLVDGPFSQLTGQWQFKALSHDACKVSVDMNFEFDRSLVPAVFGNVFGKLISMELDAFQQRAQQLYGKA
ncbi:MAG: type II toxin-antitoxin system RatA family toxin [Gammaproteobacteria bacterium]|nr:type II toxin-antitoxin system RatA family toxin [Gammaproteobacteria bacterium]